MLGSHACQTRPGTYIAADVDASAAAISTCGDFRIDALDPLEHCRAVPGVELFHRYVCEHRDEPVMPDLLKALSPALLSRFLPASHDCHARANVAAGAAGSALTPIRRLISATSGNWPPFLLAETIMSPTRARMLSSAPARPRSSLTRTRAGFASALLANPYRLSRRRPDPVGMRIAKPAVPCLLFQAPSLRHSFGHARPRRSLWLPRQPHRT